MLRQIFSLSFGMDWHTLFPFKNPKEKIPIPSNHTIVVANPHRQIARDNGTVKLSLQKLRWFVRNVASCVRIRLLGSYYLICAIKIWLSCHSNEHQRLLHFQQHPKKSTAQSLLEPKNRTKQYNSW